MTSTIDEQSSISNELIPALESLQMDRSKSRSSSTCSNEDSICSLEIVEAGALPYQMTSDELPIFSISSMSPTSRSLSPVMADQMCISPVDFSDFDDDDDDDDDEDSDDLSTDNPDRMLLNDIHQLIGTPDEKNNERRLLNLETIFEDVFLETPPKRKQLSSQHNERNRYSFESISRYVKDRQKFEYSSENYEAFSVNSECTTMEQNKSDS